VWSGCAIASQTGAALSHLADGLREPIIIEHEVAALRGCVCVGDPELIGCARLARLKSAGVWSGCAIASQTGAALSPGRRPRRRSVSSVGMAALRELRVRGEILS
jgi:hypothetical protein